MLRDLMAALLHFSAGDIKVDGLQVDHILPQEWLSKRLADSKVQAWADGRIHGRISRSGPHDMVVRCKIEAAIESPCVRCLQPAHTEVRTVLSLLLEPVQRAKARGPKSGGGEYEFQAAEADIDSYDGEKIILDDFVREAVLLEIPNFPLCSEACPGIGPGPNKDLQTTASEPAVDPRLAPLGAFRKKAEGAATTIEDLVSAAADRSVALGRKPVLRSNRHETKRKKSKK